MIDIKNITLWGYSSGTQIAMLYAYGAFGNAFSAKNHISTIVSEAGPIYFDDRKVKEDSEYIPGILNTIYEERDIHWMRVLFIRHLQ